MRRKVRSFLIFQSAIIAVTLGGCGSVVERFWLAEGKPEVVKKSPQRFLAHGRIEISGVVQAPEIYPPLLIPKRMEVDKFVRFYTTRRRPFFKQALDRGNDYLPRLKQVFKERGLPEELVSIALVESGFNSNARSHMGATGMWQFMKRTGRHYGLRINWFIDDRKNVIKSTRAAANYLRDLYTQFSDWYLAIAAYNGGPGRVRRAIQEAKSRDFFEISRQKVIRLQTREFVVKVLAAAKIVGNQARYGFIDKRDHSVDVSLIEKDALTEESPS